MAPKTCSKKIKRSEFLKARISNGIVSSKKWLKHITDESPKAAIPVGPRFQADIPDYSGQIPNNYRYGSEWLGAKVWEPKYAIPTTVEEDGYAIGKGRPDSCSCALSGSAECVKLHVREKSDQLMSDLGPVFQLWRFHKIGDAVGDSCNLNE